MRAMIPLPYLTYLAILDTNPINLEFGESFTFGDLTFDPNKEGLDRARSRSYHQQSRKSSFTHRCSGNGTR